MTKGILIVVEGINGAGKTSIIDKVVEYFESKNRQIVVYKFPNRKGKFGKRIDRYLKGELTISSKYDILHMFAANRYNVKKSIEDDINDGKIVICDRYIFSAIAYHIPKHVTDAKKINLYCNVIGYFDKSMPIPDIVYLIEGAHILKRKGIMEIFHYTGEDSQKLKNMIYKVINHYSTRFNVLTNYTNRMHEVVSYITNDIEVSTL